MAEKEKNVKKQEPQKEFKKEPRKDERAEMRFLDLKNLDKDTRLIVRICGKDLNGTKSIARTLMAIKGIGQRFGAMVAITFEKETGVSANSNLGKIKENQEAILEDIIQNPIKHGIPDFFTNRHRDPETGTSKQLIMSDLDFALRQDLQRMGKIKSYKGLRHSWGLTVRGQRTRSTHHHGGKVVGVVKKLLMPGATEDKKK